jgi:hypothetical protein
MKMLFNFLNLREVDIHFSDGIEIQILDILLIDDEWGKEKILKFGQNGRKLIQKRL